MKSISPLTLVLALIAVCLVKIAFFSPAQEASLIPQAHATGAILEWQGSNRIITSGEEGAVTYVWDYDNRTEVRKYSIKDGQLVLDVYKLKKD